MLYRKESPLRIIIIRHGDPDYEHDSLTPRGDTEAKLLADIIDRYNIDYFYVSPLGRAQRTASFSLEKLGKTATTLDWLKEFPPRILRPDGNGRRMIAWDWRPADWTKIPEMYDKDKWCTHPIMHEGGVDAEAAYVYDGLDTLLAKHGYERDGNIYRAVRSNHDTIALVCHFGIECVLLPDASLAWICLGTYQHHQHLHRGAPSGNRFLPRQRVRRDAAPHARRGRAFEEGPLCRML